MACREHHTHAELRGRKGLTQVRTLRHLVARKWQEVERRLCSEAKLVTWRDGRPALSPASRCPRMQGLSILFTVVRVGNIPQHGGRHGAMWYSVLALAPVAVAFTYQAYVEQVTHLRGWRQFRATTLSPAHGLSMNLRQSIISAVVQHYIRRA